jgi:hypothetical protein
VYFSKPSENQPVWPVFVSRICAQTMWSSVVCRPAMPSGKTTVARPITSGGSGTFGDALGSWVALGSGVAVARGVAVALADGTAEAGLVNS